jgi:restriction endonuclease S subunit
MMQGTKGMKMPRGDKNIIPNFEIVIPQDQQTIISEIETYEQKIAEAKAVMAGCAERKKQILEKWLK